MKKYFFTLVIFLISIFSFSQNLVPNSSFEEGVTPEKYSEMNGVKGWELSSSFSSDYFKKNAEKIPPFIKMNNMGVPTNDMGFQQAKTGIAYSGLCYAKEIIQCQLEKSFIKDSTYYLEFYTNLANSSGYAIWKIGAFFSVSPLSTFDQITKAKPQILNDSLNYITDTINWTKISGYYKASGGEKFLSIGSFSKNDNDRKIIFAESGIPAKTKYRYYYIDDVSLVSSSAILNVKKDVIIYLKEK
ncbi:MAG: hypothetical protein HXX09_08715 [Bacteroidetes bacterium]|nr:hypothetical protein [Bacteroidota bacterium]